MPIVKSRQGAEVHQRLLRGISVLGKESNGQPTQGPRSGYRPSATSSIKWPSGVLLRELEASAGKARREKVDQVSHPSPILAACFVPPTHEPFYLPRHGIVEQFEGEELTGNGIQPKYI